ncbi:MAG: hypothetical protein ACTTJO_00290 [Metamycoplasmataceae bacterium]
MKKYLKLSYLALIPTLGIVATSSSCKNEKEKINTLLKKRDNLLIKCNELKNKHREPYYKNLENKVNKIIIALNNLLETKADILEKNIEKLKNELNAISNTYNSFGKEVKEEIARLNETIQATNAIFSKGEASKKDTDISALTTKDFDLENKANYKNLKINVYKLDIDEKNGIAKIYYKLESTLDKFKDLNIFSTEKSHTTISGFGTILSKEKNIGLEKIKKAVEEYLDKEEFQKLLTPNQLEKFKKNKSDFKDQEVKLIQQIYNPIFEALSKEIKNTEIVKIINNLFVKIFTKNGIKALDQIIIDYIQEKIDLAKIAQFEQNEYLNKYFAIIREQITSEEFKKESLEVLPNLIVNFLKEILKNKNIQLEPNKEKELINILIDKEWNKEILDQVMQKINLFKLDADDKDKEKIKNKVETIFKPIYEQIITKISPFFNEKQKEEISKDLDLLITKLQNNIKDSISPLNVLNALNNLRNLLK